MKRSVKKLPQNVLNAFAQITSKDADIQIPAYVHKEYIAYHNKIDCDKYDCKKVIEQSKKSLNDNNEDEVIKMKLLFLLGNFATKECFDILMAYISNPQSNQKEWALLALKDLQLSIENEVYEEGKDMIMSPMGGKGNMARYFIVIGSKHNKRLDTAAKKIITEDLFATTVNEFSQVEGIEFGINYVLFTILISFDIASQKVIDTFLDKISKEKGILKYHFFIVNTHKIMKAEIKKYLQMDEVKKL
jgi:hypothetical protein